MDNTANALGETVVGLDIGTTKVCAIAGRINEHEKVEVVGMAKTDSLGVMRGVVANISKTVDAIEKVTREISEKANIQIKKVYVGIAGQHIKSMQHRGILMRDESDSEISREDVKKLIQDMHKLAMPPGDRIIHVLPQEYIVDNEQGIKEPIGMAGRRLEANFHIITGQVTAAQNINRCVEKAGLEVADLILEPLASSAAVLSGEEKEAGVALVDIGGGTTDIAIFQDGIIRHTAVIPFAGNVVTEDIREGCLIMREQAERLKMDFGSALATENQENAVVSVPGLMGRKPKEIALKNLAHIIQARMEEIIDMVYAEIRVSGFEKKLIGGIVLTGGGAQLKHLVQLVEFVTGMPARIGYPSEHLAKSIVNDVKNPMFSTGVGLIIKGYEDLKQKMVKTESGTPKENKSAKSQWWRNIFDKGKKFLEEDVENDF
ncbi:MAG TPA: cell division protein FtsA [Chitinophagales bacterium]|nr:cell division protein FtsA [Chitinophagales bacterium]